MKMFKVPVLILGVLLAVGCGVKIEVLTPNEFNELIEITTDEIVLDVRTPEEYASSHLKDAKNMNVHSATFSEEIAQLDKSTPIFVYCKSGARSAVAAELLSKEGFNTIYDLEGGLLTWQSMQLPLEINKKAEINKYTLEEYNQVIDSNKLVLVDFYADWCGPCKMMAPHIESVKKKYGEKLTILKVDTDKSIAIGQHFNITGIPLVKVYFEGKEVYDRVGYHKEEELETILKSYL